MTVLLYVAVALVAYGLGAVAVCALAPRESVVPAGMPAAARNAAQAALRRALGARPKGPRHAGGGAR